VECGVKIERIEGNPDPRQVSTSYVERQNLTMRMSIRRFTRLTSAFSKNLGEPRAFVTPAMAACVTDRLWSIEDIAALVEAAAPKPGRSKTYRKRSEASAENSN
jgi:hypothetical protein